MNSRNLKRYIDAAVRREVRRYLDDLEDPNIKYLNAAKIMAEKFKEKDNYCSPEQCDEMRRNIVKTILALKRGDDQQTRNNLIKSLKSAREAKQMVPDSYSSEDFKVSHKVAKTIFDMLARVKYNLIKTGQFKLFN